MSLVVMDELGPHEAHACRFQEAVFRLLDGSVPVLGVLQAAPSPFLARVGGHPNVTVVEVTKENRDLLLREKEKEF